MAGGVIQKNNANRKRRVFRAGSEINITPLVDVMLVLMIIFMVTAPMMTVGVQVDLPKTQAAQMNDQSDPIVVSINSESKIFLQETEVTTETLTERLASITENNKESKIYVRGDRKLAYGQIMEIMGAISSAGYKKVSLIAEIPSNKNLNSHQPKK